MLLFATSPGIKVKPKFDQDFERFTLEVTQQCAANEMDSSKIKKAHTGTTAEAPKKPKNLIKFDLMREVAAFFKTKGKL